MESVVSDMDEMCSFEDGSCSRGGSSRVSRNIDEPKVFKSKNINAERKRRQRISERLLMLRSLVPIITNMNKATIIDDAITYIEQMQKHAQELTDQLLEIESASDEESKLMNIEEIGPRVMEMKIEEDVEVTSIHGEELWIRIVLKKKMGAFTKLMEAMSFLGLQVNDASFTTTHGAILVTSCVEVISGRNPTIEQIRGLLLAMIGSM